jgi:hypothetical protein
MRRLIWIIMIYALSAAFIGCGGSRHSGGNGSNTGGDSSPVKQVIASYFTAYYDAQKSLTEATLTEMLADNDNIRLNEAFRSVELEKKKLFNTAISDYSYQIKYKNVNITENTAAIDLILDLDYYCANSPNVKSGIYNVNYSFTLKNNGNKWVITGIDSDLDEFKIFKDKVEQKSGTKSLAISSQADAILQAKKAMISQFQEVAQSINQSDSAVNHSSEPDNSNNTAIVNSIYHVYTNYSYSPSLASAYAQKYAKASSSSRIFYTAYWNGSEVDCTNFVSQCVWAGYGGYVESSTNQTNSNISNMVRMVSGVWYGGSGGGSENWEEVPDFFTYMVSSKVLGPQAVTDFSNYNARHYYDEDNKVTPASIKVGDVIQYWKDGKYCHSSIVSVKGSRYTQIKVCYHTSDNLNKPLADMLAWTPYIRRLTPLSSRPFAK